MSRVISGQQLGTNVKLLVEVYRQQFNYPAWFENTLGYAESGQISALALQQAAGNLLEQGIMTKKPQFAGGLTPTDRKREIEKVITDYYGDDISLLHSHAENFGTKLEDAKTERQTLQDKIESLNPKIAELHEKHRDQETRITRNAEMIGSHTHNDDGKPCACEFWDIGCKFNCASGTVGKYAIIAGVGIVAFFLLKARLKL